MWRLVFGSRQSIPTSIQDTNALVPSMPTPFVIDTLTESRLNLENRDHHVDKAEKILMSNLSPVKSLQLFNSKIKSTFALSHFQSLKMKKASVFQILLFYLYRYGALGRKRIRRLQRPKREGKKTCCCCRKEFFKRVQSRLLLGEEKSFYRE